MTNKKLTALLPKTTRDAFQVVDIPKGSKRMNFGAYGTIDFSQITVKRAEKLIATGFTKLAAKPPSKKSQKKGDVEE